MFSRKQKPFFKVVSVCFLWFEVIIFLLSLLAQYLASIYIFAHDKPLRQVLLISILLMFVLASSATIAAGYIINNFYDSEKDLINRPQKSMLDRLVSQNTNCLFILS